MAAGKHRKIHDVKQTKKIAPLISFSYQVSKLVSGVNIVNLDFGVQIDPIKQPIQRNSVGSGHVSHRWTSAFDDHLDHSFVIVKNLRHSTKVTRLHVWGNIIDVALFKSFVLDWSLGLVLGVLVWWGFTRRVSSYLIFGVVELVWGRMKHFYSQIPKIESGNLIYA